MAVLGGWALSDERGTTVGEPVTSLESNSTPSLLEDKRNGKCRTGGENQ